MEIHIYKLISEYCWTFHYSTDTYNFSDFGVLCCFIYETILSFIINVRIAQILQKKKNIKSVNIFFFFF